MTSTKDTLNLGDVVVTRHKERYKIYQYYEGRYLENIMNGKELISLDDYGLDLKHLINPDLDILEFFYKAP